MAKITSYSINRIIISIIIFVVFFFGGFFYLIFSGSSIFSIATYFFGTFTLAILLIGWNLKPFLDQRRRERSIQPKSMPEYSNETNLESPKNVKTCSSCGNSVKPSDKFCMECGTTI